MNIKQKMQRFAAYVLSTALIVCACSAVPSASAIAHDDNDTVSSRSKNEKKVTVIVELESPSVLQYDSAGIKDGQLTKKAARRQNSIESEQEKIQKKIREDVTKSDELSVLESYGVLTNAFVTEIYEDEMDSVAAIDGVSSVYIPPEIEAVPTEDAGDISSLDLSQLNISSPISYTGEGKVIAVVDTGINLTHEAFSIAPASPKLTLSDISSALPSLHAHARAGGAASSYYYSAKLPFVFNYADSDLRVVHNGDSQGDHGTHVAGIVAGFSQDAQGNTIFSGVAPDAQLLIMKVFGNSSSGSMVSLISAAEDALILGADSINYSLGSFGGFSYSGSYPTLFNCFEELNDAGVTVTAAAGNYYTSGYGNLYGNNLNLTSNPDNGSIASLAAYSNTIAVASESSQYYFAYCVRSGGRNITYTNNHTNASRDIRTHAGQSFNLAVLRDANGTLLSGSAAEFASYASSCGVSGSFVMVKRGQTFTTTAQLAQQYGAAGLIVCNTKTESLRLMAENTAVTIPALFISLEDGTYIASNPTVCTDLEVITEQQYVINPAFGAMSASSSCGVTPELYLKPDITAQGESVYSTTDNSTYGLKSGTSMASPYIAGSAAVIEQYLETAQSDYIDAMTAYEVYMLTNKLLMSSAAILTDTAVSAPYSPRRQGSGGVDLAAAVSSPVYLEGANSSLPKLSLGDDAQKTGVYVATVTAVNMTQTAQTYTVGASVLTEAAKTETVSYTLNGKTSSLTESFMSGNSFDITAYSTITGTGSVTVPAGGSTDITVTIALKSSAKNYLDTNYENGIYVDGFITLTSDGTAPQLSAPFLAFYGDWTKAPMFDDGTWDDVLAGDSIAPQFGVNSAYTKTVSTALSLNESYKVGTTFGLTSGSDYTLRDVTFSSARSALSSPLARPAMMAGDSWNNSISSMNIFLMRQAMRLEYKVVNADTGEVYSLITRSEVKKAYYNQTSSAIQPTSLSGVAGFSWNGKDASNTPVPNGTRVTVYVTASLLGGNMSTTANTRSVFSFDFTVDATVPVLTNADFSRNEQGELCADLSAYDSQYIKSISVKVLGEDSSGNPASVDESHYFSFNQPGQVGEHLFNLTQCSAGTLAKIRGVAVEVDDWAGNGRYNNFGSADDGKYYFCFTDYLTLVCNSIYAGHTTNAKVQTSTYVGSLSSASRNDNVDFSLKPQVVCSSSDEAVATVSADGKITGVSAGTTNITATDTVSGESTVQQLTVSTQPLQSLIDGTPAGGTAVNTLGSVYASVTVDKNMTLDLGGASITSLCDMPVITVTNGAKVTVKNGTLTGTVSNENLLQTVFSGAAAVKADSGSVMLDEVIINGAVFSSGASNATIGSAVSLSGGATLKIKDSELYGLYGVENSPEGENAGGVVTMMSGDIFGVIAAVKNLTAQSVVASSGSELYDLSNAVANSVTANRTNLGDDVTALCAARNGSRFTADFSVINESVKLQVRLFPHEREQNDRLSYSWKPYLLSVYCDGVLARELELNESSDYLDFTLNDMPQGAYTANVSYKLYTALTPEQLTYIRNADSKTYSALSKYTAFLSTVPSLVSDSLNISAAQGAIDTLSLSLDSLSQSFSDRDALGVDTPLSQDYANSLCYGKTGTGASDSYGTTWSQYFENSVAPKIYGGTQAITYENGVAVSPAISGETYVGVTTHITSVNELLNSLVTAISQLQTIYNNGLSSNQSHIDIVAQQTGYICANAASILNDFSLLKAAVKSDTADTANESSAELTLLDNLLSTSTGLAPGGEIVTLAAMYEGSAFDTANYKSAVDILVEWNRLLSGCCESAYVPNFDVFADSNRTNAVLQPLVSGTLSEKIVNDRLQLFTSEKEQSDELVTLELTVIGGGSVSFSGMTTVNKKSVNVPKYSDVTLLADDTDGTFLYWVRKGTNRIVCVQPALRVTAVANEEYEAVFSADSDYRTVTYKTPSGNILLSCELEVNSDEIDVPQVPTLVGYTSLGWDKTVDDYKNVAGDINVTACYTLDATACAVTITNENAVSGAGIYNLLDVATISAQGSGFTRWTDESGNTVSYSSTYAFHVVGDCTFTAVYEGAVDSVPVIRMTSPKNTSAAVAVLGSERCIPDDYTVVSCGIIVTGHESVGQSDTDFVLDGEYVTRGESANNDNCGSYLMYVRSTEHVSYARAYAVLCDANGEPLGVFYSVPVAIAG